MKIQVSKDYLTFKVLNGNRMIKPSHVKKIQSSMAEKFIPVPIIVNEKRYIIDGQHRWKAAEALGEPITFIQINGLGLSDVQRLNTNAAQWSLDDFMESYIDLGNQNYARYKTFKQNFKFGHEPNFVLLSGNSDAETQRIDFRNGRFLLTDRQAAKGKEYATRIIQYGHFFEDGVVQRKHKAFVIACCRAFAVKVFNHSWMLRKLKASKTPLRTQASVQDYTRMLEEIYFKRVRPEKHFRLDVAD